MPYMQPVVEALEKDQPQRGESRQYLATVSPPRNTLTLLGLMGMLQIPSLPWVKRKSFWD